MMTTTKGKTTKNVSNEREREREDFDVVNTTHGTFHLNPSLNTANTLEASDWKDPPIVAYQTKI